MATHNIVPNSDNDGKLGTSTKRWAEGNFASALKLNNKDVVTDAPNDNRNYIRKNQTWAELQSDAYIMTPVMTSDASQHNISFTQTAPATPAPGQNLLFESYIVATNELDGSSASWTISGLLHRAFDGSLTLTLDPQTNISIAYWSSSVISANINKDNGLFDLVVTGITGITISWQASTAVTFSQIAVSSFVNFGCTDDACENYSSSATADNQTCIYPSEQQSVMFEDINFVGDITSLNVTLINQKAGLSPAFNSTVYDYTIQASTVDWTNVFYSVTINNGTPINSQTLVGRVLRIIGNSANYYIRILPSSINIGNVQLSPQTDYTPGYYLTTSDIFGSSGSQYCTVYDQTGYPVWYTQTDSYLNWSLQPGKERNRVLTNAVGNEHHYSLKLKYKNLSASAPIGLLPNTRDGKVFDIDPHEFIEINYPYNRNGNLILAGYCPDASYGGFYIQEQNPAGQIVWEWFSADYFNATLNTSAATTFKNFNSPEAYHLNSIDVDPRTGNLLVSMRTCSAVICIEYSTKNILWGFGGSVMASGGGFPIQSMAIPSATQNTKWLTFINEPSVTTTLAGGTVVTNQYNGTAAQHDVRFRDSIIPPLTPGNHVISLYDNQSTDQAPQTASPQPAYPNTTTPTPRSRACVFEIDLVNNHIIHRSSIFSTASWLGASPELGYRKSSFMGSYTILLDKDSNGNSVYTHTINFTNEHPNLKEYIGPIDGAKTQVFAMDLPGVLYRIIKVPVDFLKKENMRGAWASYNTPPTVAAQQPFTPIPLETGLKAYWNLNDSNTWADASGGGHALTANGTVTNGNGGVINKDAVFNGSSYLFSSLDVTGYSQITISAWVKSSSLNDTHFIGNWQNAGVLLYGGGGHPSFYVNGASAAGSNNVADGSWHHWVGTYDGTNISLYIDGVLAGTGTSSGNINDCSSGFGIGKAFYHSFLTGEIDEVGIWNRALNSYEAHMLYGDGAGMAYPFIPTGGLRLWLDASDSSNIVSSDSVHIDTWKDKSGNGKDAIPFAGSGKPVYVSTASLGGKKSVTFNNAGGNHQILVTDPIYSVGYSQLTPGTIIGVASAANTSIASGDTGCRWVDMVYTNPTQSGMGLLVKTLGVPVPVWGGFISESYLAEKPLLNFPTLQAQLLAAQQAAAGQTVTSTPTLLTSTSTGAVNVVLNAGGTGTTAIPASALGIPNSQFISAYYNQGTLKAIAGDNVTFYDQVADQPTNNGISIGGTLLDNGAIGLRSTIAVAEVMVYDRVLSAAELAIVVGYLRAKYTI